MAIVSEAVHDLRGAVPRRAVTATAAGDMPSLPARLHGCAVLPTPPASPPNRLDDASIQRRQLHLVSTEQTTASGRDESEYAAGLVRAASCSLVAGVAVQKGDPPDPCSLRPRLQGIAEEHETLPQPRPVLPCGEVQVHLSNLFFRAQMYYTG